MEYVDKPEPAKGYVALIVVLMLTVGLPALAFPLIPNGIFLVLFAAIVFPLVLLTLELLHAAYATEYRVSENVLDLRCGWIMHRRIPLQDILSAERTPLIARVTGWSPGVLGYCNRFTDGVLLRMATYAVYVSPGDTARFMEALQLAGESSHPPEAPLAASEWLKRLVAALSAVLGIIFMALGIPLIAGAVPPNYLYGFRVPATLSDPELWYYANRVNGVYLSAGGIVILVGAVLMFAYARRLSLAAVIVINLVLLTICTIGSLLLTMWHIS